MPELPEVETIVRELQNKIKGRRFKSVEVKVPKLVKLKVADFGREIENKQVTEVRRRAKLILIGLDSKKTLLIHLKLTGQLVFRARSGELTVGGHPQGGGLANLPNKFTHIIFELIGGSFLYYNDLRKFGWMNIVSSVDVGKSLDLEFGVEPLSSGFTLKKFKEILIKKKNQPIKKFLLDQKNIAGIGNIYADEICFRARIKPLRRVKTLAQVEVKALYKAIIKILKLAISKKGTSTDTYVQITGEPGGFLPYLKVYGRAGEKCMRCGGVIKKIKIGGRGAHFCPKCQR